MADLCWLTRYGPEGASSRYRAYQLEDGLEQAGWRSSFEPLAPWGGTRTERFRGVLRRLGRLSRNEFGASASAVVVQKEPIMPASLYRPRGRPKGARPLIWDVDDAVWIGRRGALRMSLDMCRRSDVVVAGNHLIEDWARSNGAEAVVIPTCYEPTNRPDDQTWPVASTVNLVWIGSPATSRLLEPYGALLAEVMARVPELRCRFVGGPPPHQLRTSSRVSEIAWSPTEEAAALEWADYGLAMQLRNAYNDHKCGFKTVQYMSHGVVPLVTEGPVHQEILGGHGVLLDEHPDLEQIVERISRPPTGEERAAIIERWQAGYSLPVAVARWSELLRDIVS